ncbi:hypothetical protein [Ostreibacterium oceani]|uniref:Uncharacterized protein n=1 Tax=Ostreibacterium oceani TaxID=2654998 RepID=A0A6N7ETM2_9GAMM|nr:hypothetical protein [Ostreibacterium oceani]MPV86164.1 hypothetical protein [Ostreibacterium oceani]
MGFGSYGYEPKLRQSGVLARPTGILPGSMATNMRGFQTVGAQTANAPSIGFAMGMNSSLLESAISEQLFCNEEVNPDNNECYGISTVSGLQRAAAQGQKIYQIDKNNRDQLANIRTSDENMANDIQKAINSGGYVIVPEKAVDGVGRNAIYVYMTYNDQTGNQSWKISGGLNGAIAKILGVISDLATLYTSLIDGDVDIIDLLEKPKVKKIFQSLGRALTMFGIMIDFLELLDQCGPIIASLIAGWLATVGFLMTQFSLFLLGGFVGVMAAILAMVMISAFVIPMILNEFRELASGLLCSASRQTRRNKFYA